MSDDTVHLLVLLVLFVVCQRISYSLVRIWQSLVRMTRPGRGGVLAHLRLVFLRDIRVRVAGAMLAMLCVIVRDTGAAQKLTGSGLAFFVALSSLLPVELLARAFSGPDVLLLRSFDHRGDRFAKLLGAGLAGSVVTSLAEPYASAKARYRILGGVRALARAMEGARSGSGTKVASDEEWRAVVQHYMNMADAIVVDVSDATPGLLEEIAVLASNGRVLLKTAFVCRDPASATDAVGLLRRCVPENVNIPCYGQLVTVDPVDGRPTILQNVFNEWLWRNGLVQRLASTSAWLQRARGRVVYSLVLAAAAVALIRSRL